MATPSLSELLAQKAALEQQILEVQRTARADAVAKVRALMSEYGLTVADLGTRPALPSRKTAGTPVAPKYRHPATGETWSGRGLKPKWLRAAIESGAELNDFKL